jgi:hypothetical protein
MSKQPTAKSRRAATSDARGESSKDDKPGSKAPEPAPATDVESAHQRAS